MRRYCKTEYMKKIISTLFVLFAIISVSTAQQSNIPSAKPGIHYGKQIDSKGAISVKDLEKKLNTSESFNGKVQGEVVEVCKKKGCFITLKREEAKEPITVRFTDYAYFMPQDIVGKTVVVEGRGKQKTNTVEMLRHQAEDLGKSAKEVAAITQPTKDISFVADGVLVIK